MTKNHKQEIKDAVELLTEAIRAQVLDEIKENFMSSYAPTYPAASETNGNNQEQQCTTKNNRDELGRRYLSPENAYNIRVRFANGESQFALAQEHGVERQAIVRVLLGESFKNAGGPLADRKQVLFYDRKKRSDREAAAV